MRLHIQTPLGSCVDAEVEKVTAEAENGAFCLLPRHIDFVTSLAPGILSYVDADGVESFVAVDRGILVKVDADVRIACRHAVAGAELGALHDTVRSQFLTSTETERRTRSALARLEVGFVRNVLQLREVEHEREP